MQKTALVIMAAGLGSRFKGGIKQLKEIGENGETIMEYSVRDAVKAGFDRVVLIIRREMEDLVRSMVGDRLSAICPVTYVYQDMEDLPEGFTRPENREKPWGTGHAVRACRNEVTEPFVVINADDYYGEEAFQLTHEHLIRHYAEPGAFCMAGFILKNTLSENGSVNRAICSLDQDNYLLGVEEVYNIHMTEKGPVGDFGKTPDANDYVSMNLWGVTSGFFDKLEEGFIRFLKESLDDPKAEFHLPSVMNHMIENHEATVKLYTTHDRWFGITHQADVEAVKKALGHR